MEASMQTSALLAIRGGEGAHCVLCEVREAGGRGAAACQHGGMGCVLCVRHGFLKRTPGTEIGKGKGKITSAKKVCAPRKSFLTNELARVPQAARLGQHDSFFATDGHAEVVGGSQG
eukprot:484180-Pelagomonas_calceolata.AAC.1